MIIIKSKLSIINVDAYVRRMEDGVCRVQLFKSFGILSLSRGKTPYHMIVRSMPQAGFFNIIRLVSDEAQFLRSDHRCVKTFAT
jgi:hypothetical protein